MEIIVDDRERAVTPFLEDASIKYNMNYKIQRNEVGDYAITYKGYILLLIERKTWTDLSASMRDGRKENVQKLFSVREKTGCQIAYLIEGDATPAEGKKYGRIPIKNLRAHLDHLSFRDGVHMVYSKNTEYTANRLFELALNYLSLDSIIKEIDDLENAKESDMITGGDDKTNGDKTNGDKTNGDKTNGDKTNGDKTKKKDIDELTTKQNCHKSIEEQLLRCLPGVGSVVSTLLAENKITVCDLYNGKYSAEDIAEYKYNTGACIGMDRGEKIAVKTKKIIDSKSKLGQKIQTKLLASIPLISEASAKKILESVSLGDIMSGDVDLDTLESVQKTEKMKVGKKAAENILKYLSAMIQTQENDDDESSADNATKKPAGVKPATIKSTIKKPAIVKSTIKKPAIVKPAGAVIKRSMINKNSDVKKLAVEKIHKPTNN